ncbi:hydrogenase maturation nickel metallochaperone HypA [Synechococcus elongatus]|uniref:Hydrogenase maturation factor HypA n=2 Tax=Synechococcus elongatus TaxID=32046 RepID=HYPA_SYNE7|nr:hydrogenase maturation nickel metallochaperone HypA [Synechococcus elongatus]P94160.2 RecName: Full=Hydrogenase maturation factor HypA [Synechococcus elongatus PCC 6301]Q31K36.1 RecName: Full=Hydrogenase maturation factor HypA [Synechococcus elongatus PCC 7942 = FACHB-805]pir/S74234/ hypA protein - Synechococcus sp. (PCC 6301) [Synechococcus sp.]MBD2688372.1 hydrogenase maturation nickel metallochaperone HypA [Synechococcus elongatus FACHB-1061]ABB58583.1 hydrogenase nickel insertion protei
MHELSLATALVETALWQAVQAEAQQIVSLKLRLGTWAGVDAEALRFAFSLVQQDTIAASAQLVIESVPAQFRCQTCGQQTPPPLLAACSHCGSDRWQLQQGRELQLQSMEVV